MREQRPAKRKGPGKLVPDASGLHQNGPTGSDADGLDEAGFRRVVRSRFSDVEIDLLLELVARIPAALWAASGEEDNFAVRLWSPGAELLYGFKKEDILGRNYIEKFVNRLERKQAVLDHKKLEATRLPYRNLARDRRKDKTTRLMLTQGVALWHPVLGHYMQGELTVDATDVPGKDRNWLEQVLTPEAVRKLLEHFNDMTQAAFESVEKVAQIATALVKAFLGESAESLFFVERQGVQLSPVGGMAPATNCEFDPKAVVRWATRTSESAFLVDYAERQPPTKSAGGHFPPFPNRLNKVSRPAPFAVGVVRDDAAHARGGVFVYLAPGDRLSELTDGILAAVCGSVKLALAIEERIVQAEREIRLAAKERERQSLLRLAKQFRHVVVKKAYVIDLHAGLIREVPAPGDLSTIAHALHAIAQNLLSKGKSFETELHAEQFSLAELLNSVTGAVMQECPGITLSRDTFPDVSMTGVRPFIEGAFENLLLNAVEAQGYKGQVGVACDQVRWSRAGSSIDIVVSDNGPGILPAVAAKIRDGEQISTKGTDRGLGLKIARLSIEECQGQLELLPTPPLGWTGAAFRVRLPVVRQRATPAGDERR